MFYAWDSNICFMWSMGHTRYEEGQYVGKNAKRSATMIHIGQITFVDTGRKRTQEIIAGEKGP